MENYFNYFTEIEEHFCRRRGTLLSVSTLDWALMETWKEAGIPLEAVLRGIDVSFDRYESRPAKSKTRKINGLAWCAQEVLAAAEEMKEAAAGALQRPAGHREAPGLSRREIVDYLSRNTSALAKIGQQSPAVLLRAAAEDCSKSLQELSAQLVEETELQEQTTIENSEARKLGSGKPYMRLEVLEQKLTVMEERLLAALILASAEADLAELRAEADREMAPYRSKMPGFQIEQLRQQFVHKRLFERAKIPRLSLFYL